MKKFKRINSVALIVVSFMVGSVLSGNNIVAAKLGLTGSGTPGRLAKWTSPTNLGDSTVSEDANGVVNVANGIRFSDGSVQTTAPVSTESHFKQIRFSMRPDEQYTVELPVQDSPVRLEIAAMNVTERYLNGVVLTYPGTGTTMVVIHESSTNLYSTLAATGYLSPSEMRVVLAGVPVSEGSFSSPLVIRNQNTQYVTNDSINYVVNMWY